MDNQQKKACHPAPGISHHFYMSDLCVRVLVCYPHQQASITRHNLSRRYDTKCLKRILQSFCYSTLEDVYMYTNGELPHTKVYSSSHFFSTSVKLFYRYLSVAS